MTDRTSFSQRARSDWRMQAAALTPLLTVAFASAGFVPADVRGMYAMFLSVVSGIAAALLVRANATELLGLAVAGALAGDLAYNIALHVPFMAASGIGIVLAAIVLLVASRGSFDAAEKWLAVGLAFAVIVWRVVWFYLGNKEVAAFVLMAPAVAAALPGARILLDRIAARALR